MSSVRVASLAEAESLLSKALAGRTTLTGSSGRSQCHIGHAVVRICFRTGGAEEVGDKDSSGGGNGATQVLGNAAVTSATAVGGRGVRQASSMVTSDAVAGPPGSLHPCDPVSRMAVSRMATAPPCNTLTVLDCCSPAATLLLPDRPASAARLGLLSLGNALGRAHLGERSMGLRETQITR